MTHCRNSPGDAIRLFLIALVWVPAASSHAANARQAVTIEVAQSRLHVVVDDAGFRLSEDTLLDWVRRSAEVVGGYYGRFPTEQAYIAMRAASGRGVKHGGALVYGPTINITLGTETGAADLERDWVLVHEMIHLALPSLPRRHHWLEEGLAVYVESVARANAGDLSPEQVWRGFVQGMPHGLPEDGDRGLDFTPTWGRTYWGGALFCLLADIDTRKTTANRKTLRHALRGIVAAGLDMTDRLDSLSPLLAMADEATGTSSLTRLYERMGAAAESVDLARLWNQLGVVVTRDAVRFDDGAPLAAIRDAITERDPGLIGALHYGNVTD